LHCKSRLKERVFHFSVVSPYHLVDRRLLILQTTGSNPSRPLPTPQIYYLFLNTIPTSLRTNIDIRDSRALNPRQIVQFRIDKPWPSSWALPTHSIPHVPNAIPSNSSLSPNNSKSASAHPKTPSQSGGRDRNRKLAKSKSKTACFVLSETQILSTARPHDGLLHVAMLHRRVQV
jgi:hypothetical protein